MNEQFGVHVPSSDHRVPVRQLTPQQRRDERALLVLCQAEVDLARAQLHAARGRAARVDVRPLRESLVRALEDYAAAIERSGAPAPQRLMVELNLYRGLGGRP